MSAESTGYLDEITSYLEEKEAGTANYVVEDLSDSVSAYEAELESQADSETMDASAEAEMSDSDGLRAARWRPPPGEKSVIPAIPNSLIEQFVNDSATPDWNRSFRYFGG
jgi:hypothetical protein